MSGKHHHHRKPGVVRVICTSTYHHDSAEFAANGHHFLDTLRMATRPDNTVSPFWMGNRKAGAPVKDFRRADGSWVLRFRCSCGLDVQRIETKLTERIRREFGAHPDATRIDLDIVTL